MKKTLMTAVAAAITLTVGVASAQEMEKCQVVKDGKGLIKANKADCKSATHNCAGQNAAADAEAWIMVPKGQCEKINKGDMSGVSQEIKDKIEAAPAA